MPAKHWKILLIGSALVVACSSGTGPLGITVVPGTWSYTLSEDIPLPGPPGPGPRSCRATSKGTATMSSEGTYAIIFPALTCSNCTMSASTSGALTSTSLTGIVSASIAGAGCSDQQPSPNPAQLTGNCDSTSCTAQTPGDASFALAYTLTPPR